MDARRYSLGFGALLILGAGSVALAPSCTAMKDGESVGQAQIEIVSAPPDAACLDITVMGSTTASAQHDLAPGQTTVFQESNLPTGDVVFAAQAFAESCDSVTPTSVATWVSDPVPVTLIPGENPKVPISMHRNTGAQVIVDFQDGQCLPEGSSCTDDLECCSGLCDPGLAACQLADLSNGLAGLPASVKTRDLRLNPPVVKDITVEPAPDGTLMRVRFAPDLRLGKALTIFPDGTTPVILHDDGVDGDDVAGDLEFVTLAPASLLSATKQQLADTVTTLKQKQLPLTVSQFHGRVLLGEVPISTQADASGRIHALLSGSSATVIPNQSLLITDVSVVEDPVRTFDPCAPVGSGGTPMGEWTFGYLMTQMANANPMMPAQDPADFVEMWLNQWLTNQTINGYNVPNRNAGMASILAGWPRLMSGRLDLSKAPMRLLAIVNRIDLGSNPVYGGGGSAGEGRFVFGVLDPTTCAPMQFTVILEYGVPFSTCPSIQGWANDWLNLSTLPFPSPAYNTALAAITNTFTHANANPSKPNGSAINQVRTDEFAIGPSWELREFRLDLAGTLAETTIMQNPDASYNGTSGLEPTRLGTWINLHNAQVCSDLHTVGLSLDPVGPFPAAHHFRGGSTPNFIDFWQAPGISTACCADGTSSRFHFSENTCNGCHGAETGTGFLHVTPRGLGSPSSLSGFLTGTTVSDPAPLGSCATTHTFNDLARRATILSSLASSSCFTLVAATALPLTH